MAEGQLYGAPLYYPVPPRPSMPIFGMRTQHPGRDFQQHPAFLQLRGDQACDGAKVAGEKACPTANDPLRARRDLVNALHYQNAALQHEVQKLSDVLQQTTPLTENERSELEVLREFRASVTKAAVVGNCGVLVTQTPEHRVLSQHKPRHRVDNGGPVGTEARAASLGNRQQQDDGEDPTSDGRAEGLERAQREHEMFSREDPYGKKWKHGTGSVIGEAKDRGEELREYERAKREIQEEIRAKLLNSSGHGRQRLDPGLIERAFGKSRRTSQTHANRGSSPDSDLS